MSGVEAVITYHLEIPVRDMLDEQGNKVHDRDSFADKSVVLMPVIVEGDEIAIIGINPFQGDGGPSEVTANVFSDNTCIAKVGFGIDIETVFVFAVNESLGFFERRPDVLFQSIEEGGLESVAQESITEMFYIAPEGAIGEAALGNKAMDVRVPLEGAAEGMEDTDEAGDKVFGFIKLMKQQ